MTLRVERVGQGPALVLLHGWAMHSGLFAPLVQALRDAFELHLVDLPGHGHNAGAPGPLTLASAAEAVLAEAPQRALWLGWSLGGLVAMQVAAPSRASHVVRYCCSSWARWGVRAKGYMPEEWQSSQIGVTPSSRLSAS